MSHVVTVKTQIKDVAAVQNACKRLGLPAPVQGTIKLFDGEAVGLAIQLPDWTYPVVADLVSGELRYDNFGGRWGDQKHLDQFLQTYAIERVRIESHKRGYLCTEQLLSDGSVKLTLYGHGGAA